MNGGYILNENRDDRPEDDKEIVEMGILVKAEPEIDAMNEATGRWVGIFKLSEDSVGFSSQGSWEIEGDAIAWATEAGQHMVLNAIMLAVPDIPVHWDE